MQRPFSVRFFAHALAVVAGTAALSGCGAQLNEVLGLRSMNLYGEGKYGELIQYVEAKQRAGQPLSYMDAQGLCAAYVEVKRFDKVFPCAKALGPYIARGEVSVVGFDLGFARELVLASTYMELGDYAAAVTEADKAYDYMKRRGGLREYQRLQILPVVVLARRLAGQTDRIAEPLKELEGDAAIGFIDVNASEKANSLSKVYFALGDYQRALDAASSFRGDSAFIQAIGGAEMFVGIHERRNFMIAKSLLALGRRAEAKAAYAQLLASPVFPDNATLHWQALHDYGGILLAEGQSAQAIERFRKAIGVIEAQRSTIGNEASKIGFVGDKQGVYRDLVAALVAAGRADEAFDIAERGKARALVDLLAEKKDFKGGKIDAARVAQLLDNLQQAEVQLAALDTGGRDRVRGVPVGIRQEIAAGAPELASLVSVDTPGVRELQALLPGGETLVEYYGDDDAFFAFVLTAQGVRAQRLDGKGLTDLVGRFRAALADPRSAAWRASGTALHDRLVAPLAPLFAGTNLTLVPHGSLHYLPFTALPAGDGTLLDRYAVRVLPSASVMKFLKDRTAGKPGELLALGNPDLNDARLDLPGAQVEAAAITSGRARSRVLLRKAATETVVKEAGNGFRYLHFASHGVFDPAKPLASALLLAGDGRNDGKLTVSELYDLNLDADLVTLSACETALGKIASGDDVVGFTRGFLYAGVSSIVSSLWQVEDEATRRLMEAFYRALDAGADKRGALRQAQQTVARSYNPHPFYWAAFQLTGAAK